jgi:hypothetical protein
MGKNDPLEDLLVFFNVKLLFGFAHHLAAC